MAVARQNQAPPDFLLMHATRRQTIAARRFDSRWNWESGYDESPLVSEECATSAGNASTLAQAARLAAAADFALVQANWDSTEMVLSAGETRKMDVAAWEYSWQILVMELTGQELLAALQALEKQDEGDEACRFLPKPQAGMIKSDHVYRVAVNPWAFMAYVRLTQTQPPSLRITDQSVKEAVERFWPD